MQLLKRVLSLGWVSLHSVAYLVMAGVMMAHFGGLGAGLWFALGWVTLMPTLFAPHVVTQFIRRQRERTPEHVPVEDADDTFRDTEQSVTAQY